MHDLSRWVLLTLPCTLHVTLGCLGADNRRDALLAQSQLDSGVILYDIDAPADDFSSCPATNKHEKLRNGARVTLLAFESSFSEHQAYDAVRFSSTDEWPAYVIENDYVEVALEPSYYLACFWMAGMRWPAVCGKIHIREGEVGALWRSDPHGRSVLDATSDLDLVSMPRFWECSCHENSGMACDAGRDCPLVRPDASNSQDHPRSDNVICPGDAAQAPDGPAADR